MSKIKRSIITPDENLALMSQKEISELKSSKNSEIYDVFRACSLAVLSGDEETDDPNELLNKYKDFEINLMQVNRGVKIELTNAPSTSFVDGEIIQGIKENLFAVLRDILYVSSKINSNSLDFSSSESITNSVFKMLRNTKVLVPRKKPNLIVCWGGHSIGESEYKYSKKVGYELGLRGFDICTGCGPGVMKGPMKGATIAHAKTRMEKPRYVGISEPGIIASESPNAIVNNLIIMPDIEKRLESFVRMSHGIIVFPGGVGTAEELLYLMGILMHPENKGTKFPVILTGPEESKDYFKMIDSFILDILGEEGRLYEIVFDEKEVAKKMNLAVKGVENYRVETEEAFYYNWALKIDEDFQKPFIVNHENVSKLNVSMGLPKHELASNLRKLFSIIVAGNIKPDGIKAVEENGPFEFRCDDYIMERLDLLLTNFIECNRMKLPSKKGYNPCYRLIK
jgi:predicted Rossmann-fold nucleotide-binding protein